MEKEIEILEMVYRSKSDIFIYPLTGLRKDICKTYMFWENHSIEDYKLIMLFEEDRLVKKVIEVLNSTTPTIESYNIDDKTILVADMSEWAFDIDLVLNGKYSKMTESAKKMIIKHHLDEKTQEVKAYIFCILFPKKELDILGNVDAINYVAKQFELPLEDLEKSGELGRIYDIEKETLSLKVEKMAVIS